MPQSNKAITKQQWQQYEAEKKTKTRTRNTKPTNQLTKDIKSFIKDDGYIAWRINVTGIYKPKLKKWVPSGSDKGVSDLIAIKNGLFIGIDVKYGTDKMKKDQIEFKNHVERLGGRFIEASSIDQFIREWKSI